MIEDRMIHLQLVRAELDAIEGWRAEVPVEVHQMPDCLLNLVELRVRELERYEKFLAGR